MPVSVRYEGTVFFYNPPAPGEPQAARRTENAELTWSFADRRNVDGVLVPYHITLTARSLVNGQTYAQQEIRLERVKVNVPLGPGDFTTK